MKPRVFGSTFALRSLLGALSIGVALFLGFGACSAPSGGTSSEDVTAVDQDLASGRKLQIRVRDSETGIGLRAQVAVKQPGGAVLAVRDVATTERMEISVPRGAAQLAISAPGHQLLDTHIEEGELLPTTVLLDPDVPAPEMVRDVILGQVREGFAMLHGHVVDSVTGAPIEGATVRLVNAAQSTQTNPRGYFVLHAPLLPTLPDELPASESLVVEKLGYKTFRLNRTLVTTGATHFPIELDPGAGEMTVDDTHKIVQAEEGRLPPAPPPPPTDPQGTGDVSASYVSVPLHSSIRLGYSCSCTSCGAVVVLSLGSYDKRGLNDEWIASWSMNSLRAGAVAYRSYGEWYAYHPLRSNYDICNNTCCQVNDSDTNTASDQAVTDTSGVVVQKSGAVYRAEYAAENNDNYCADGYTGQPSANWPCMSDSPCKGKAFNGHGRGMCQWGTQRWAATYGKDWVWIVNHYYNNNGNPSGARSATLGNY